MTAAPISEAVLQASVIDAAKRGEWLWFHDQDPRRNRAGFPDLVLVHPLTGRLLFVELKSDTGRIRPEQQQWIDALTVGGHTAVVWRPEQWRDGTITAVLLGERQAAA